MRVIGSSENQPLVSIILLNYNGDKYIHSCAKSIAEQTYVNIEVIVIDNGCTDGSMETLKAAFPYWTYIQYVDNIGFAAGMNSGFDVARGDYVVPLNQDVYLDKNFVNRCVAIMETRPKAGALSADEYKWSNGQLTDKLRSPGPAYYNRLRIKGVSVEINDPTVPSFGFCGSFPFLRRKMLEELLILDDHIYDPAFFSGWEDIDLWWRMQLRGWECYATRETKAWHVGSSFDGEKQSFITKSAHYQSWIMRNRWFVILKDIPLPLLLLLSPLLLVQEIVLPFYFLFRSPRTLSAWRRSWREVLVSLPEIYAKRCLIQETRKKRLIDIMRWFRGI
jgi:GT2 family glycosyltransferase